MYKALISDFDGTLFDSQRAISAVLLETFKERDVALPTIGAIEASISMGITLEETLEALRPELKGHPEQRDEWVVHYRKIYNAGLGITASSPFPGLAAMLEDLRAKEIPVIVVSNKGEAAVWNTLKHYAVDHMVCQVVAAFSELPTKPHPDSFFHRILPNYEHLQPNDFLVFGDTATDMKYARAIGAGAAYASYGYGKPQDCLSYEPDLVVTDMPLLLRAFE